MKSQNASKQPENWAEWVRSIRIRSALAEKLPDLSTLFALLPVQKDVPLFGIPVSGTPTIHDPLQFLVPERPEKSALLLIRILAGSAELKAGSASLTLRGGTCILLSLSSPVSIKLRLVPCTFSLCILQGDLLPYYLPQLSLGIPQTVTPEKSFCFDRLAPLLVRDTADPCTALRIHQGVTDLLTLCLAAKNQEPVPKADTWLLSVNAYIHTQYMQPFSLEQAERQTGISRYRICRTYRETYGRPPLQDLNHVRIEEAKKRLLTTDLSVQEISSAVGMENVNHFIELFKRQTGMTPRAFRKHPS